MLQTDSVKTEINKLSKSFQKKLLPYNLETSKEYWKECYESIRGESWPDCNTPNDFKYLPIDIKNECIEIHNFSCDIWKKEIKNDVNLHNITLDSSYDLTPYKKYIENKNILDFACAYGSYSFDCLRLGASSVKGIEVRKEKLRLAKLFKHELGIPDYKLQFLQGNIHDYKNNQKLCKNINTVLLNGILYHVNDHYNILKSICAAKVENIIIETGEASQVQDLNYPAIYFKDEPTFDLRAGWEKNKKNVIAGYPNYKWFDLTLSNLGYHEVKKNHHEISLSNTYTDKHKQKRTIYVYSKNE